MKREVRGVVCGAALLLLLVLCGTVCLLVFIVAVVSLVSEGLCLVLMVDDGSRQ